ESYLTVDWRNVATWAELLVTRMRQLERRVEDVALAAAKLKAVRMAGTKYFDKHHAHKHCNPLPKGSLVLALNTALVKQKGKKFAERWNGPYLVVKHHPLGSYILLELDRTIIQKLFAAKLLKHFYPRPVLQDDEDDMDDGVGVEAAVKSKS